MYQQRQDFSMGVVNGNGQAQQMGAYQQEIPVWQAGLLQDGSLQQMPTDSRQWLNSADANGMAWGADPAASRGSAETLTLDALVADADQPPWEPPLDPWSGAVLPSFQGVSGGAPNPSSSPSPAVGSSSPVDSHVEPPSPPPIPRRQQAKAAAAVSSASSADALTAVWPSLVSDRRPTPPPAEAAPDRKKERATAEEFDMDTPLRDDDDSYSDEDDRGGRRGGRDRYKRRAGRMVREQRRTGRNFGQGKPQRNGNITSRGSADSNGRSMLEKLKAIVFEGIESMPHSDMFIQSMRFALFCAMAWSVNSIIYSLTQLYNGEIVLETPGEVDAVKNLARGTGGGS